MVNRIAGTKGICICGHGALIHIASCFARGCKCEAFEGEGICICGHGALIHPASCFARGCKCEAFEGVLTEQEIKEEKSVLTEQEIKEEKSIQRGEAEMQEGRRRW